MGPGQSQEQNCEHDSAVLGAPGPGRPARGARGGGAGKRATAHGGPASTSRRGRRSSAPGLRRRGHRTTEHPQAAGGGDACPRLGAAEGAGRRGGAWVGRSDRGLGCSEFRGGRSLPAHRGLRAGPAEPPERPGPEGGRRRRCPGRRQGLGGGPGGDRCGACAGEGGAAAATDAACAARGYRAGPVQGANRRPAVAGPGCRRCQASRSEVDNSCDVWG
mmetsp:Transcript_86318/g.231210  ORF Transcript_86318/g.231210 Transcript_86318/m.231210 type:complete len:218 (+) Transcript_86318:442-1095(+)